MMPGMLDFDEVQGIIGEAVAEIANVSPGCTLSLLDNADLENVRFRLAYKPGNVELRVGGCITLSAIERVISEADPGPWPVPDDHRRRCMVGAVRTLLRTSLIPRMVQMLASELSPATEDRSSVGTPSRTAEAIKQARSGICPKCGGQTISCSPLRVHPATPDNAECYGCIDCEWCCQVFGIDTPTGAREDIITKQGIHPCK